MADRTSTDEVIDILVETGKETIESARTWGRRLISSLADHTEIEKPRHLRVIPDLDHPSVTTGRFPGRFRPTVTVTADVTAKDFREAEMILARDVSTALPSDYNVDVSKSRA